MFHNQRCDWRWKIVVRGKTVSLYLVNCEIHAMRAQLPRKSRLIPRNQHKLKKKTVFYTFNGESPKLAPKKLHNQPKWKRSQRAGQISAHPIELVPLKFHAKLQLSRVEEQKCLRKDCFFLRQRHSLDRKLSDEPSEGLKLPKQTFKHKTGKQHP